MQAAKLVVIPKILFTCFDDAEEEAKSGTATPSFTVTVSEYEYITHKKPPPKGE